MQQSLQNKLKRLRNADTPSKDNESSDKNQEGGSSKGSRSPPSVVERLGFPPANSSEKKIKAAEQSTTKRKRSSTSGGRDNKKARLNGREDTISPPSVFHRLGSQVVVPEENQSGDKKHSAHIAANTQSHSVQRIVLASVEPIGKSGGLAVMWKECCRVEILQANKRIIDMKVQWQDKSFYLSCIYGEPVKCKSNEVWERITRIGVDRSGPWVMTGDFNEILDPSEKLGGTERDPDDGKEFKQMISACGMGNIKYTGYQFSWAGTRNKETVQCRLDRTVANQELVDMFPQADATYLKRVCSDHSPVLTTLMDQIWKRRAGFKFDKRWLHREGFTEVFRRSWQGATQGQSSLMSKIATCRKSISLWKRFAKPNSALRIQKLHHKIDTATRKQFINREELHSLRTELNEKYQNEKIFWQQKSRLVWLISGDQNTKFFHAVTKNRRAQNIILSLIDNEGKEWYAEEDLGRLAENQWIGSTPTSKAISTKIIPTRYRQLVRTDMCVSDLMTIPGKEWNREAKILAINPQGSTDNDTFAWDYTHTQVSTPTDQAVRKVNQPSLDELYQQIWKLQTSPKIRHFLWKCISDSLPAAANMRHRHIAKDGNCGRCNMDSETVNHILFTCPYARLIWAVSPIQAPPNGVIALVALENLEKQK
ncbi:hypothetical protein Bca52824_010750 [Brassica carinata]|uniref:Reverse transcriptase zinc-binding domain-containing protein n=1 Tax=Brassica carinata TaxID=52824 RepID=A0A8X7WEW8_BRACI|nr:hypothetical protein Bca52824_010750 [Brassica carinata]